ncbi:MAG: NAD-dependent malic enzyme, partial [Proteobacteria bacterium]|nr:NAD-dependent malic enzyme [Pseudomonadota bacterium]
EDEARRHCWFVDSRGLLCAGRDHVAEHKLPYAHEHEYVDNLLDAVRTLKPTALLGLSGQPQTFTKDVVGAMAENNERPIVFALSNPTSMAECTAEQAYGWTDGRAVFASGSPFDPVVVNGRRFVPGQGNNAYVFPGVGLGVIASRSRIVTDAMFLAAAHSLASQVCDHDLEQGLVYPRLSKIREVSAKIAADVAGIAWDEGYAQRERPDDVLADIRAHMYRPVYPHYV